MNIEGAVIKVELKPQMTQIEKLSNVELENAKQDEHNVEIKCENQALDQNEEIQTALSIEETKDFKLENKEIRSYKCGKSLNSEENSSAMKERSTKKAKVKEQNICVICNKYFSTKIYLKRHVTTVHDEGKQYKCDVCSTIFGQKGALKIHFTTIHRDIKAYKCESCEKIFSRKFHLKTHSKSVHEKIKAHK